jgi:hypothetical protein
MDSYRDGYPGEMADVLAKARGGVGLNPVGDIRLEGEVSALPGCSWVEVHLREGARRYRFVIRDPRPAPRNVRGSSPRVCPGRPGRGDRPGGSDSVPAARGKRVSFAAQNMDDLLGPGDRRADDRRDGDPGGDGPGVPLPDESRRRGRGLSEVEVYRDIFYTEDGKKSEFDIPAGCYVMLGDNTQDSSDSRF